MKNNYFTSIYDASRKNAINSRIEKEIQLNEKIYLGLSIRERYNILFDGDIHERINWDTLAFRDIPSSLLSDKKTHWAIWEYIEERDGLIIYRTENVGMLVQFAKYASGIFKIERIIF